MRVFIVIFDDGEMDSELRIVKVFDSWKKAEEFLADPHISVLQHQISPDEPDRSYFEVMIADVHYANFRARGQAERTVAALKERSEEFFHLKEWDVE